MVLGSFGTGMPRLCDGKYLARARSQLAHKKATSRTPLKAVSNIKPSSDRGMITCSTPIFNNFDAKFLETPRLYTTVSHRKSGRTQEEAYKGTYDFELFAAFTAGFE